MWNTRLAAKLDSKVDKTLLTFIVPVHNMSGRLANLSKWLEEARIFNVKVVLVHDRSQDTTGTELHRLCQSMNSEQYSVLDTDVQSPGLARNCGLNIIDTPWFSFVDADDLVDVPSVLKLLTETQLSDRKIGVGSYLSWDLRFDTERVVSPPQISGDSLALHLAGRMGLWRFVFSSSIFGDIRFTQHKMGEDYLYLMLILNQSDEIYITQEVVYRYFHSGSFNLTSNQSVMSEMIGVVDSIKKIEPQTSMAKVFRVLAIQKLTLSILKNLGSQGKIFKKLRLLPNLILHPIYFSKLLVLLNIKTIGYKDE